MKLKPLGDNIVVQAAEAEEQTKSGLFIPETAKEKPQKGTVIAVGDGKWDETGTKRSPVDVKEGDMVTSAKYGGSDTKVDHVAYKILRADDIYAVVQD
jgi:chaperonin GroES